MRRKNQRRFPRSRVQNQARFFKQNNQNKQKDQNTIKIVIGRKRIWVFNNLPYDIVLRQKTEFIIVKTYENKLGKVIVLSPQQKLQQKEDENEGYEYSSADWV